ncbi:MAG TPA: hydantoinase/oxoprolinase family protein, partial [Thermodesulfobacteriota bacterium]|nr:hydantoinase/oxoprolinase family protein [Thermodesulfobacteriota bacterium]
MPAVRIGIDVGGTFTKAVAVLRGALLGQATVPTTHRAPDGVAAGVLAALDRLLRDTGLDAGAVALVAHSTTQATNALLEGDVCPVGIVAMGPAAERARILRRAGPRGLELAPGQRLTTVTRVLETDQGLDAGALEAALDELVARGCRAIAASELFGVDDPRRERAAVEAARRRGLPATAGSELTGVYGFEVRTLTAAVNASILPRMIETARMVEEGTRARLAAPLLVLKGDGGVATMETFRTQPLLTVFSGPAAGLAGALRLKPLLDGLFLEVGGTSTHIALARGGEATLRYVRIGDFATCVRAADVRVVGVAGGSLARVQGRRLVAVGPRSAHIAGLPYAAFTPPEALAGAELVRFSPLPGDPADYVAVRTRNGALVGLTPTCAANALGLVPESDYARGRAEAARLALAPLARLLGGSVEEAARALLDRAARQLEAPVRELLREHRLARRPAAVLVGGGGAAVLGPAVAARLGLPVERAPHAEVIGAVGAALAMIRVEREEAQSRPTPEALAALRA